ncbi:glycosyltransferase 87 family protein [Herbiconiux sp. 11R-BC]|uniref:glycosyltransferase 87 family protein n=1 Tax=Herbiconiux sp. 11R-BC TaxID=3111637 RepID=UPI003BFF49B4
MPAVLWCAFLATHLWLGYDGLYNPNEPFGDVTGVYLPWVQQSLDGFRLGIDGPWVYPILAFLPMLASMVLGPGLYGVGWMIMVTLADAAIFAYLITRVRPVAAAQGSAADEAVDPAVVDYATETSRRITAAWWWLGFLLLLGPVSLGRIDIFTVDLVIAGLLVVSTRPALAGVLLALATWVKVWPAAIVAAAVIAVRRRFRVAVGAVVTLVGVALVAFAFGSGLNVFSFISEQNGRGMQVESPASTLWMWLAFAGDRSQVFFDSQIITFEVAGPGSGVAAKLMTPLLVVAVAAILVLAFLVVRSGASATVVLPPLALALVTALIVFNKVGSPQFMVWLSAPIILGIATQGRRFFVPAIVAFVMGGLTQIIYPIAYDWVIGLDPVLLTVLTVRNLLTVTLLVMAVVMLWKSRNTTKEVQSDAGGIFRGSFRRTVAGR